MKNDGAALTPDSPETKMAIDLTNLFCRSYINVFHLFRGKGKFEISPNFQLLDSVQTRHRISTLLDFTGSINGIVIINYTEDAAVNVVSAFLQGMGMGEDDCPKGLGEELINVLGEIMNQVLGAFRRNLSKEYGLSTTSGTPVTMIPSVMLNVTPVETTQRSFVYVRAQISTPSSVSFYVEFCVQKGVIIKRNK